MNEQKNIACFVAELRAKGVGLSSKDDKIKFHAPQGIMTDEVINVIKKNKESILELLNLEKKTKKLVAGNRKEKFKLTDVQSAYLLGRKAVFQYGNTACHIYMEIEYTYPLYQQKVESIWNQLIRRHSMLRAIFEDSGYQKVLEEVPYYTLYTSRSENKGKTRNNMEQELGHKIYEIDKWPLYDIGCMTENDGKSILIISIDFMIADWASIWILIGEFEKLYKNPDVQLPELKYEFCDYIETEQRKKLLPQYYIDKKYWMDRMERLPGRPELPLISKKTDKVRFKRYKYTLPKKQWDSMIRTAKETGVTPSAAVMTAYAMAISKWSETKRFLLNLTMLNRQNYGKEIENIVGDFTAVTLLEVDFSNDMSFAEAIRKLQYRLFSDIDHQLFSGIDVLRELSKIRGNDAAMMPVVFTSGIGVVNMDTNGIIGRYNQRGISQTPQVFIDCQVLDQHGELSVNWDVREATLLPGVPEEMFHTFVEILNILSEGQEKWKSQEADKNLIENIKFEEIDTKGASKKLLYTDIIEKAETLPEKIAVISRTGVLTYRELIEKSWIVQNILKNKGCLPNMNVGIAMPKSHYQVMAVMGVLLNGAAYVPIDISQPEDRINRIIQKARIQHVVSIRSVSNHFPENVEVINIDKLNEKKAERAETMIEGQNEKPAYVIYTSGSTGDPKGVVISHLAALNTITHVNQMLCVGQDDSILGVSRLSFDLSVYDIFGLLSVGGTLIYPDENRITDPSHLYELMVRYSITLWNSVPAIGEMVMDYMENEGINGKLYIRKTLLSGDWIPLNLPDRIVKNCALGSEVISLGGATEAAIWSIYFPYRHLEADWNSIPYGKALPNQQVYVLDRKKQPCFIGVKGDIYISGMGLAIEYLNEPELTEKRFVTVNGVRMYDTGDKGRYIQDGNIEFLGREDTQVKINGYRIELGEIEANLEKINYVKRASVIDKKIGNEKKIVAFLEKSRDCIWNDEKFLDYIRKEIKNYLPVYLEPNYYIAVESTPLTPNGKIDRKKLNGIEITMSDNYEYPKEEQQDHMTPVYKVVENIWCELLQQNDIKRSTDLHLLGADSLLMAQAVGKIRKKLSEDEFGIDLPFDVLLKQTLNTPTLNEISIFIGSKLAEHTRYSQEIQKDLVISSQEDIKYGSIKFHKRGNEDQAIVIFHAGLGTIDEFSEFIRSICSRTISTVISVALNDVEAYCSLEPEYLFEKIAAEYTTQIAELRFKQVQLVGHCIGGMLAFEVAKNMVNKNISVTDLSLIDSIPRMYNIEDEIIIELMFLPVLNISYGDMLNCNFCSNQFLQYLSIAAEKHGGNIRETSKNNCWAGNLQDVADFINMLRKHDFDRRVSLYLEASNTAVSKELFESLFKVFKQSTLASSYSPVPYFGDLRLFKADKINEVIPENIENTIDFWNNNCLGNAEVIMIPGNHFTCIEDKFHADALADHIVLE